MTEPVVSPKLLMAQRFCDLADIMLERARGAVDAKSSRDYIIAAAILADKVIALEASGMA